MPTSTVSLISASATPCGVESFARLAMKHMEAAEPGRHDAFKLTGQPGEIDVLRRALATHDALIVSLPVVAWKRLILAPLRAMRAARRLGKDVVLVLHEWGDLDWKRRATYVAYLPYATRILFSSPAVRAQFEADATTRLATRRRGIVPIPPNIEPPEILPTTAIVAELTAIKRSGKLILGHFGSIYPKKQSLQVLDIAAALKTRGQAVHVAFVGSFIGGGTIDPRPAFEDRVAALGLAGDVTVTGYIGPSAEVFAALEACDVFVYLFAEGLTSRRGSVLACLMTSHPVIVNAPAHAGEFDHHPSYRAALGDGRLTLLPTDASPDALAEAILTRRRLESTATPVDFSASWRDAVTAIVVAD